MNTSEPQIPERFFLPLQIIAERLQDSGIDWAITGSLGWALQGIPVEIHDIDLQTDEAGAVRMEELLSEFSRQKLYRRISERLQSHFAVLEISRITVEIMGALQKRLENGQWEPAVDIRLHRRWVGYHNMRLPVLSLEYEHRAYNQMGRTEKAHLLEPYLHIGKNTMTEPKDHHGAEDTSQEQYPNETMRLLMQRASLRSFSSKPVPADVLRLILDAGNHAASGGNLQPWSVIKIQSPETRHWLAECCQQGFIEAAPVSLIFCIDFHRLKRWADLETGPFTADHSFRHFWIAFQDTIIAAQNTCTAADAMGLGSVYIGTIMEFMPDLQEKLKLPQGVIPVVLVCLGYPKNAPVPRKKLGVDALVHEETYHELDDDALLAAFNEKYSDRSFQITPERLETIEKVCLEAHGHEFADRCIAHIKEAGTINPVIHYFGLHYLANEMPMDNPKFLQILQDCGIYWMKEFQKKDH
ncbi:MAG: nitroreductase family protein [Chloroflexi bacterium]|nr:nitroreductase family protein [Chloroflexota bacterium]